MLGLGAELGFGSAWSGRLELSHSEGLSLHICLFLPSLSATGFLDFPCTCRPCPSFA